MTALERNDICARGFLWLALLTSLLGFLGYYDAEGFVTPAPFFVLAIQLIAVGGGTLVLRHQLLVNIRGIMPLILVAGWAALTLLWADDPATALRRWLLVFVPAILLCALAARDTRPQHTFTWFTALIITITFASGAFTAIVLALSEQTVHGDSLRYVLVDLNGWTIGVAEGGREYIDLGLYIPRFSGLTSNPNSMGLFAAVGLIALCTVTTSRCDARSVGLIMIVALIGFILVFSASRAAIAMGATGLFFVFLLRTDRRQATQGAALLVGGMIMLLYSVVYLSGVTPDPGTAEVLELRERAQVWPLAMGRILDVWPFGVGFGLTQEAVYTQLGLETAAHSMPLSMFVETGIIGLALVLFAWYHPVFKVTQRGRTLSATDIAVVSLLMALLVHQTVDSSVFRYHWAHFVFVYLLGVSTGLAGSRTSE